MANSPLIIRGNIVTPTGVLYGGTIEIGGGMIQQVIPREHLSHPKIDANSQNSHHGKANVIAGNPTFDEIGFRGENSNHAETDVNNVNPMLSEIDIGDGWVIPGFIDVHVHGGNGANFMDATNEAFRTIVSFHGCHGTTSMVATTVTASKPDIDAVLDVAASFDSNGSGARLLGVHLEGPFISPLWPGAQNKAHIKPPNLEWIQSWLDRYPGLIKIVTLAPETDGALALIDRLREHDIICAAGHTDASYEQLSMAMKRGLSHAVHAFNAMKSLHHRDPGAIGFVLTEAGISAEVIADGHHVHPAIIKLLVQMKENSNLLLVTDAISAAGLSDGPSTLGGLNVVVKDGVARIKDSSVLAGSTLTMIDAFRYIVNTIGLSVPEASRLASETPAKLLRIDSITGSIQAGKAADLVLLTPSLQIRGVLKGGTFIYRE